jgi:hypothetical protein
MCQLACSTTDLWPCPGPLTGPYARNMAGLDGAYMRASDAFAWQMERDPALRSTIAAIMWLDRAPGWDVLTMRIDRITRFVPSLRQRVIEPPLRLTTPRWAYDPHFDLTWHLRRVGAPAPGTRDAVMALVRRSAMGAFDRDRPLWELTLVEGIEGGEAALILKIHHSLSEPAARSPASSRSHPLLGHLSTRPWSPTGVCAISASISTPPRFPTPKLSSAVSRKASRRSPPWAPPAGSPQADRRIGSPARHRPGRNGPGLARAPFAAKPSARTPTRRMILCTGRRHFPPPRLVEAHRRRCERVFSIDANEARPV